MAINITVQCDIGTIITVSTAIIMKGWSPSLSVVLANETEENPNGSRRLLKIIDWIGGTGSKPPLPENPYLGINGFTTIDQATDIRGATGKGIESITWNEDGQMVISYDDGSDEIISSPFAFENPIAGQMIRFDGTSWVNFSPTSNQFSAANVNITELTALQTFVNVSAAAGNRAVNLPVITDSIIGRSICVKKSDSTLNTVSVNTASGQNIEWNSGATYVVLNTPNQVVLLTAAKDSNNVFYWSISSDE